MNLELLRLFQRINELGSLAAAARDAGLSTTTVSERLSALEEQMGATLLSRTTRSLSLTDAGRTLLEGAAEVLEQADSLTAKVRHGTQSLSGNVRISAPSDLGRTVVSAAIAAFQADHPQVTIELLLSDGYLDIVGEGIHAALRYGDVADSTWKMRKMGSAERVLCAAPAYIDEYGAPGSLDALKEHRCLVMRFGQTLDRQWVFQRDGQTAGIVVTPYLIANDGHVVRQWCIEGRGIALKSSLDVADDLATGRLVRLLQPMKGAGYALHMLFPPGRSQPARVQAFAKYVSQQLRMRD